MTGSASGELTGFDRVSVRRFGAAGDGSTDDTAAIQAAIDAVSAGGGGAVAVPSGAFVTGSLFLKDNVTLWLDPGAFLLASLDPRAFPIIDARWEGVTRQVHASIINAFGARRISVAGRGTMDGRGRGWWERYWSDTLDAARPRSINVDGCEDVLLEGIRIVDSPSWTINPVRSRRVRVHGVSIRNPPESPTTDGINPDSCSDVIISDCHISVGDDCVTLKSGTEHEREGYRMPCEDIVITNCIMERGHGGVVIGSEMSGSVRNVAISNCVFKGTDRGLRIKTRRGRGGVVERVRASNIVMTDVLCPFTMNMRYHCGGAKGNSYVADREAQPVGPGTPVLRDIAYSNITVHGATLAAAYLDCLPESPAERISFSDISIAMVEGSAAADTPAEPEMADNVAPEWRAGFMATQVRNLRLRNVRISGQRGEAFRLDPSVVADRD